MCINKKEFADKFGDFAKSHTELILCLALGWNFQTYLIVNESIKITNNNLPTNVTHVTP